MMATPINGIGTVEPSPCKWRGCAETFLSKQDLLDHVWIHCEMADPIGTTTYIEDDVESPAQRDEDFDVQSSLVQRDEDDSSRSYIPRIPESFPSVSSSQAPPMSNFDPPSLPPGYAESLLAAISRVQGTDVTNNSNHNMTRVDSSAGSTTLTESSGHPETTGLFVQISLEQAAAPTSSSQPPPLIPEASQITKDDSTDPTRPGSTQFQSQETPSGTTSHHFVSQLPAPTQSPGLETIGPPPRTDVEDPGMTPVLIISQEGEEAMTVDAPPSSGLDLGLPSSTQSQGEGMGEEEGLEGYATQQFMTQAPMDF